MKDIIDIEKILTTGPYGHGESLNYNFNQFIDGMTMTLSQVCNTNFNELIKNNNSASKVVISGTCIMAATLSEKESSNTDIKQLIDRTNKALSIHSHEEIKLMAEHPLTLINLNDKVIVQGSLLEYIKQRFEENMEESGVSLTLKMHSIEDKDKSNIESAINLLTHYLPVLSKDVLSMVSAILPITGSVESAFVSPTPLLIYVDPQKFATTLDLADAIFHESLHHKLLTIRLTKRLLRPGYDDFKGLTVPIPWGASKYRVFSIGRSIAAAHVYLHLTLLHINALSQKNELPDKITDFEIKERLITRYQRANYLIETLSMRHYRHEYGADGLEFIEWMKESFQRIAQLECVKEILEDNKALTHI